MTKRYSYVLVVFFYTAPMLHTSCYLFAHQSSAHLLFTSLLTPHIKLLKNFKRLYVLCIFSFSIVNIMSRKQPDKMNHNSSGVLM